MTYDFKNKTTNPHFNDIQDVSPQEVLENSTSLRLIDVREEFEYTGELGHAEKTELIVLSTLPENIKKIPQDKTIVFICKSGGRSAQAAAYAKQQGFTDVYNMQGGMLFWNQLQLPTIK